jgi:MFS family permease
MDIFKRKLPMFNIGSILTTLSKLSLACAPNVFFVFVAKSLDRFAKGLRQAPSDAIVAELATKKGFAYSFRHMMNLSGFFAGSIVTTSIIQLLGTKFRLVFGLAVIPTIIAIIIFQKVVMKNYDDSKIYQNTKKWNIKDISQMSKDYWIFIAIISLLMLNRFSEGFITLKAKEVLPDMVASFPIFMSIYEICAIIIAIPIGKLADKFDKRKILIFGISLLMIADLFGMFANSVPTTLAIYICAGLHIGATQGLIGSFIAKATRPELIGTAFAIFYGLEGLVLFLSNNLAGSAGTLLAGFGVSNASGPFIVGFVTSAISILGIILWLLHSPTKD